MFTLDERGSTSVVKAHPRVMEALPDEVKDDDRGPSPGGLHLGQTNQVLNISHG